MGITTVSEAEEFSQQLQDQGQQLTPQQQLTFLFKEGG